MESGICDADFPLVDQLSLLRETATGFWFKMTDQAEFASLDTWDPPKIKILKFKKGSSEKKKGTGKEL